MYFCITLDVNNPSTAATVRLEARNNAGLLTAFTVEAVRLDSGNSGCDQKRVASACVITARRAVEQSEVDARAARGLTRPPRVPVRLDAVSWLECMPTPQRLDGDEWPLHVAYSAMVDVLELAALAADPGELRDALQDRELTGGDAVDFADLARACLPLAAGMGDVLARLHQTEANDLEGLRRAAAEGGPEVVGYAHDLFNIYPEAGGEIELDRPGQVF